MLLTNGDFVVRGVFAETRSSNSQRASSEERAKQRGDAVDFQDVFNGGVHTVTVRGEIRKEPN